MNFAVGKITDAAREAIQDAGGSIEETQLPRVSLVKLPGAEVMKNADAFARISLPGGKTLLFSRAWETEDCTLDCLDR